MTSPTGRFAPPTVIVLGLLASLFARGTALAAQQAPSTARAAAPAPAPAPGRVEGRVVMPGREKEIPVPGVVVTVHRVGPDSSGPLDSVRTKADGRYDIRFMRSGSEEAIYFAATVYSGIAYFSAPIRGDELRGDQAEITVFDTTSRAVPFTVQGHHVVVSAPGPTGERGIVEVYEVSNDTTVTGVGRDSLTAVWSAPLPAGATAFQAGQGDVAPSAIIARGGRALVLAPWGPGVKQVSFAYQLPDRSFPLRFALEHLTVVLEVLLEEPGAQARATSLRAQENATTQGRSFKRFLAQGAPAGEEVRIDVPGAASSTRGTVLGALAAVIALAMLGALWRALSRRGAAGPAPLRSASDDAESLAAAIAALDARHEANDPTLPEARWRDERAQLKARLDQLLASVADGT